MLEWQVHNTYNDYDHENNKDNDKIYNEGEDNYEDNDIIDLDNYDENNENYYDINYDAHCQMIMISNDLIKQDI